MLIIFVVLFASLFDRFVWGFSSHSRIFHSYGDVFIISGEGLQILTYVRHSWPLSSEGSLACHNYCDTGILLRGPVTLKSIAERLAEECSTGYCFQRGENAGVLSIKFTTFPILYKIVKSNPKWKSFPFSEHKSMACMSKKFTFYRDFKILVKVCILGIIKY